MSAVIHPMGQFKSFFNNQSEITVEAGRTVRETLELLKIQPALVAGVVVNGDLKTKDHVIQEHDIIRLIAIMGGG